jgi:hypothetical protein
MFVIVVPTACIDSDEDISYFYNALKPIDSFVVCGIS